MKTSSSKSTSAGCALISTNPMPGTPRQRSRLERRGSRFQTTGDVPTAALQRQFSASSNSGNCRRPLLRDSLRFRHTLSASVVILPLAIREPELRLAHRAELLPSIRLVLDGFYNILQRGLFSVDDIRRRHMDTRSCGVFR
jgi:hypothetical protein